VRSKSEYARQLMNER